jgi:hypothetical protein
MAAEAERRENLRRVRSAVELGASDRPAELAARLESLRARRAVIESDLALQQAIAELGAAMELPLIGLERVIGAPAAADGAGDSS